MDIEFMTYWGYLCYVALGLFALWGAFGVIFLLRRVKVLSFSSSESQQRFVTEVARLVKAEEYEPARQACDAPSSQHHALAQMTVIGIVNRNEGPARLRQRRQFLGDS